MTSSGPGEPGSLGLEGKVALVTGGSRGLGREIVLGLARAGADVIVSSRKLEACREVAAEVEAIPGRRALAHACHVGSWEQVGQLVEASYERFGKVDVLVNNAGMSPVYESLDAVSENLFDKVVAVNLKGPFRLSALVATRMAAGAGGSIINISSNAAIRPNPTELPYAAAKAGLNALTEGFAQAFAPKVRVNGILPGPFRTDISKSWDMDRMNRVLEAKYAIKRLGEPWEIVGAVLYFASDLSSYTTGALLRVDGGRQ
jgi:NAD(P)-dependent dehydrogenase (short-subunit alcohol dehydrogenase family)